MVAFVTKITSVSMLSVVARRHRKYFVLSTIFKIKLTLLSMTCFNCFQGKETVLPPPRVGSPSFLFTRHLSFLTRVMWLKREPDNFPAYRTEM